MKVIVTGSLGNVGKPLAQSLVQQGHAVTVISSNADKRTAIEATGAAAAIGTLEDAAFLAAALEGATAVFAMIPPNYKATDIRAYYQATAKSYVDAIRRAGVQQVVHLSSYGAHLPAGTGVILGSHDAEGIFNALDGITVTHVRAGYFYTNLYAHIPAIKHAGMITANYGDNDPLPLVHPRDIAAVAADAITQPVAGHSIRYAVSDDRTCSEVAHVLGAAVGKPDLTWKTVTDEALLEGLLGHGMPANFAANLVELGAAIHSGILREDIDRHKPTLGHVKLEDFVPEFVQAYQ